MRWLDVTVAVVGLLVALIAPLLDFVPLGTAFSPEPKIPGRSGVVLAMQVIISLTFAGASIYIILSRAYDDGTYKWAYGMSATVVGFWLSATINQAKSGDHGSAPSKRRKTK